MKSGSTMWPQAPSGKPVPTQLRTCQTPWNRLWIPERQRCYAELQSHWTGTSWSWMRVSGRSSRTQTRRHSIYPANMNKRKSIQSLGSLAKEGLVIFIFQLTMFFLIVFLLFKLLDILFPRVLARYCSWRTRKLPPPIPRFTWCQNEWIFISIILYMPSDNTILVGKRFPTAVPFSFTHSAFLTSRKSNENLTSKLPEP